QLNDGERLWASILSGNSRDPQSWLRDLFRRDTHSFEGPHVTRGGSHAGVIRRDHSAHVSAGASLKSPPSRIRFSASAIYAALARRESSSLDSSSVVGAGRSRTSTTPPCPILPGSDSVTPNFLFQIPIGATKRSSRKMASTILVVTMPMPC